MGHENTQKVWKLTYISRKILRNVYLFFWGEQKLSLEMGLGFTILECPPPSKPNLSTPPPPWAVSWFCVISPRIEKVRASCKYFLTFSIYIKHSLFISGRQNGKAHIWPIISLDIKHVTEVRTSTQIRCPLK